MEYEKLMFLHGIKGITSDYELVMHHGSSRKQGYFIVIGHQNIKTWPISMKKSEKQEFSKKAKGFELGNMWVSACSLAHRYYTADFSCTTTVHHVRGEKCNFFDFEDFFHRNRQVMRFWRPIINR